MKDLIDFCSGIKEAYHWFWFKANDKSHFIDSLFNLGSLNPILG